jgi:Fe-S cluster assembly protein SufD
MNSWLDSVLERAQWVDDWLQVKRQASLELLRTIQWPTRKTEAWKYTSLQALQQVHFNTNNAAKANTLDNIAGLNCIDVVFVDGMMHSIPATLPPGLSIVPLAKATGVQQAWAYKTFASIKPTHHLFGLVNDVLASTGVLIDIAADSHIEQPIRIVHLMTSGNEAHCRTLVRLGEAASATIIEQFSGDVTSFNTSFAEYELATSATLEHYRLELQSGVALNIGGSHFKLEQKARLNSTVVGYGSKLARLDIDINHAGEQSATRLNAIYLLKDNEHFDLHTNIEHSVADGISEQQVRGIVADQAHAVFNGRIHIHRGAQRTQAELNNRNLLLSPEAEVDTKPELEIYADDVRCAHGATVAEIDQTALYYLCSRGISLTQARLMLNFAFINELVEQIPNAELAAWLRSQLSDRFGQMNRAEVS